MKNIIKYVVLFLWVTLFLYFYSMYMPKGILYFDIGIPALYFSAVFIMGIFKK